MDGASIELLQLKTHLNISIESVNGGIYLQRKQSPAFAITVWIIIFGSVWSRMRFVFAVRRALFYSSIYSARYLSH